MAFTPEVQAKIQIWRERARAGTLTQDEMREAIVVLRQDRVRASAVSATARKRKAPVDAEALLGELDNL